MARQRGRAALGRVAFVGEVFDPKDGRVWQWILCPTAFSAGAARGR